MKKILSIILMSILAVSAVFGLTACDNGNEGDIQKGIICSKKDGTYVVESYIDEGKNVTELDIDTVVKAKYGSEAVVSRIKAGAFDGNSTLTKLIIPGTVTKIDAGALKNMKSLKELTIPFVGGFLKADAYLGQTDKENDKSVNGEKTFGYIFGTTEYSGGASMTFNYGNTTNTVFVPATLRTINVMPNADYELPAYAFSGLTMVPNINLGEKVVGIGEYCFYKSFSIESLNISKNVVNIYTGAFDEFTSLKTINYAGSLATWQALASKANLDTEVVTVNCAE